MYKRILMPTDGSTCSEAAIRQGLQLAKDLKAEVTFLYALEDPVTTIYAPEVVSYQPELYEQLKKAAQDALDRAKKIADELGVSATLLLVERKHPTEAIHEAEKDYDLIVMGTHGRRGFNRWMFGSVAEGVLRRAKTPCLMLRSEVKEN
jgi:nucleotide-binding universal stress UspA family protein